MIAKLSGVVDSAGDGWAVIDVGGVGYLTQCSRRTLSRIVPGEAARLLVETHVREDAIQLFGFADHAERDWFRLLTTVQGVGAKAALSILSVLSPENVLMAVASGDKGAITRAAGVGPRLAARIVAELREKTATMTAGLTADSAPESKAGPGAQAGGRDAEDAVAALIGLGFRPTDAMDAVSHAVSTIGGDADVEQLIRAGLAHLAPRETGT